MLRRARHNRTPALTQQEVAEALDVWQSTVSAWESGRVRPPVEMLKDLSTFLDLEIGKLVEAASVEV